MKILDQDKNYALILDKVGAKWWIELADKSNGHVQLLIVSSRAKAQELVKGMSAAAVKHFMDKARIPSEPMYKPSAFERMVQP